MIGKVIGNYKIVEKIGEGGMGAVFRGLDTMLEREVAIKMLRPELASQPDVLERFRTEAVTLAKLNHPNIATLYSFLRDGDDYFMVMEFVRGQTIDDLVRRFGAMTVDRAVPLLCQALDGIDHAHRMGIIHRDIKPANMMLTDSGSLKVMDFGIARVLGSARLTRQGNVVGTIEYMSPEAVRGLEVDARSDVYSLGILLYEMLTGRVPFDSDSEFEMMKAQVEQAPVPPRTFTTSIPIEVEQAIMRSLAKKPEARFQTAGEFRAMLLGALGATTSNLQAHTGNYAAPVTRAMQLPLDGATKTLGADGEAVRSGTRVAGSPGDTFERQRKETLASSAPAVPSGAIAGNETLPPSAPTIVAARATGEPNGQGIGEPAFAAMAQPQKKAGRLGWKLYAATAVVLVVLIGVPVAFVLSRSAKSAPPAGNEPAAQSDSQEGQNPSDANAGTPTPAEGATPAANTNANTSAAVGTESPGLTENANANASRAARTHPARNENTADTTVSTDNSAPPEPKPAHTDTTPKASPDQKVAAAQDANKNTAKPEEKKKKGGIGGFFKKIFGGGDDKKKDESKNKNP